jgi:hypothetical protein
MGGPHDRFGVASVTRKTALACLERVCALQGIHPKNEPLQLQEYSREELLPIEQLIAFAHENGLRVLPIRFDWFRLLVALSNRPVLLVLKNGNVIAAEKLSTSKEIILFDPLAPADERFLVARSELEPVWDGDALTVEPELANGERPRTRAIGLTAACGVLAATLVILFALKDSALVTHLFPSASSLSLPTERLAPGITSNSGKDALLDIVHDAPSQGDISELHGSNAREQTGPENVPSSLRNSEVSNFPAATAITQEQEVTSQTNLSGADTEQSSLEHQAPIADIERSDQNESPTAGKNESPTAGKNAPGPPQEHTVEWQHASPAPGNDPSFVPQEEKAPTSPGPQPVTASPPPTVAGSLDASRTMTLSEQAALSPPPLDKPEGASELAKAPVTGDRAPGPFKLTRDEVKTLVARGDLLLGSGDVTSARLFYERAADAPDAQAALRLGESYDPAFLAEARLNRAAGSVLLAAQWYRRADELGAPEADTLLRALAITTGVSR